MGYACVHYVEGVEGGGGATGKSRGPLKFFGKNISVFRGHRIGNPPWYF